MVADIEKLEILDGYSMRRRSSCRKMVIARNLPWICIYAEGMKKGDIMVADIEKLEI